jgi:sec-independent protein translocase protein TatB
VFNVGPAELLAILALALVVLGPDRLPGAVRTAGRGIGELRRITAGFQQEMRAALDPPDTDDVAEAAADTDAGIDTALAGTDPPRLTRERAV